MVFDFFNNFKLGRVAEPELEEHQSENLEVEPNRSQVDRNSKNICIFWYGTIRVADADPDADPDPNPDPVRSGKFSADPDPIGPSAILSCINKEKIF